MTELPLPLQRLDDGRYLSLVWGCTHDELVDRIAALFSEQEHLLEEFTNDDFRLWRVKCASILPPAEVEMLDHLQMWEIIQRAYRHRHDRVAWHAKWLTGNWGKQDLFNGIAATDPQLRERIVREGLNVREDRDKLEARIDDEFERTLEEPPGGRSEWPAFWPADRGRDRRRERT